MKNKWIYIVFILFAAWMNSCKKEEVTNIHQGLTRIDYDINNPLEMPKIEFTLDNVYDLSNHPLMSVELVSNEQTIALNLKIVLEDENRHQTDEFPFIIADDNLTKDNQPHIYTYDFTDNLQSSTSNTGEVDISRIKKVVIFINAGLTGTVSEGTFWLDHVQMGKIK
jgi:hypothetical protein